MEHLDKMKVTGAAYIRADHSQDSTGQDGVGIGSDESGCVYRFR